MSALQFHQYPLLDDNYGLLIHDPASGATASVDTGDADATLAALKDKGWSMTELWVTHHHWDHTDGVMAVKEATGCTVRGPKSGISEAIKGLDSEHGDGDGFTFGGQSVEVIQTPGHTLDMINFYLPQAGVIHTGDTLFTLGCGRLFEGTPATMWTSMEKLLKLPAETVIYSSHEYTLASAKFAVTVDPDNEQLKARVAEFIEMRARGEATSPSRLDLEMATNPFLRPADPGIRAHLGMEEASDSGVFTEIRKRKDNF